MLPFPIRVRVLLGLVVTAAASPGPIASQQPAAATPAPIINQPDNPALHGFRWRSIGPVGQGGRVDDFAVDEKNPSTYYVGFAVGGIAKTVNNGTDPNSSQWSGLRGSGVWSR